MTLQAVLLSPYSRSVSLDRLSGSICDCKIHGAIDEVSSLSFDKLDKNLVHVVLTGGQGCPGMYSVCDGAHIRLDPCDHFYQINQSKLTKGDSAISISLRSVDIATAESNDDKCASSWRNRLGFGVRAGLFRVNLSDEEAVCLVRGGRPPTPLFS